MLGKLATVYLLALLLGGLCMSASATTSTAEAVAASYSAPPIRAGSAVAIAPPIMIAQNDITIHSKTVGGAAIISEVPAMPYYAPRVRISLLLPLRSEAFGAAAEAVRAGFMAGAELEKDESLVLTVFETGDAAQDVLSDYNAAARDSDIVVGPLSRSGVTALAQSNAVLKPTIALTQLEAQSEGELLMPRHLLVMGLSVEDDARQVARWASSRKVKGKAYVVSSPVSWQKRTAKAFAEQWQRLGSEAEVMEITLAGNYLAADGLVQLKKRIQEEKPALLFAALDAEQTRAMRLLIGNEVAIYGTSQLNPFTLPEAAAGKGLPEMNGVRLVDMPWQLQPDHPAVMAYPRLPLNPHQTRIADMSRLYALGIDAFRVAKEVALKRTEFEIDGVTGRLKVDFNKNNNDRFERIQTPAVYRDGFVVPLTGAQ